MNSRNPPSRPTRPPAAKSLNDALEGVRRYRQSGRIPTMRVYDSDDEEEDEPPTPLTRAQGVGRDGAPDPILKMAAKCVKRYSCNLSSSQDETLTSVWKREIS